MKHKEIRIDNLMYKGCEPHWKCTLCGDSVYYGMPQLKVCGGKPHTYFEVYCPNCGRGGLLQFKSAYLALKDWNEMQEELHNPIDPFQQI